MKKFQKPSRFRFICILFLTATVWCSCATHQTVRYDGFYYCHADDGTNRIIRFYEDKTVISASLDGKTDYVKNWFKKELFIRDYDSRGEYTIIGNKIRFATTAPGYGSINYKGTIENDTTLQLNLHSMINGHKSSYTYKFQKIPDWE